MLLKQEPFVSRKIRTAVLFLSLSIFNIYLKKEKETVQVIQHCKSWNFYERLL